MSLITSILITPILLLSTIFFSPSKSLYLKGYDVPVKFFGTPFVDVRVDFNSWIPESLNENISEKLVNFYINKFYIL